MIITTAITIIAATTIITGTTSQTTDRHTLEVRDGVTIPVASKIPMSQEEQVQIIRQTTITGMTGAGRAW